MFVGLRTVVYPVEDIRTATLLSPDGTLVGVIENPHFPGPVPA